MYSTKGWEWHNNTEEVIKGRLWGGCLEVLDLHLSVRRYLPDFENLNDMAVKNALRDYKSNIPVVFNMNFGHTDPQIIIPNGGMVSIDGHAKTIHFT